MPKIVNQERFIKECLEAHNTYRSQHCVPNLEVDPRLSELALEWAENLAQNGNLIYKNTFYNDQHLGENILRFRLRDANLFYFSGSFKFQFITKKSKYLMNYS